MNIYTNIPSKSMRLMVKVVWTFKYGVKEMFLLAQLRGFHFLCYMTKYGYNVY